MTTIEFLEIMIAVEREVLDELYEIGMHRPEYKASKIKLKQFKKELADRTD